MVIATPIFLSGFTWPLSNASLLPFPDSLTIF
jgi:hypothetical protein